LSNDVGVSSTTIKNWLSVLKGIEHFRKVIGERSSGGCVLYNGKETYKLIGIQIVNPIAA
jgi:hypothetical protein